MTETTFKNFIRLFETSSIKEAVENSCISVNGEVIIFTTKNLRDAYELANLSELISDKVQSFFVNQSNMRIKEIVIRTDNMVVSHTSVKADILKSFRRRFSG